MKFHVIPAGISQEISPIVKKLQFYNYLFHIIFPQLEFHMKFPPIVKNISFTYFTYFT